MPGEENTPQSEIFVFDVEGEEPGGRSRPIASRIRPVNIADQAAARRSPARRRRTRRRRRRRQPQTPPRPAGVARRGHGQALLHAAEPRHAPPRRLRRRTRRPARSGRVIEERLNTYIESKPLRLAEQRRGPDLLVGARRLGPLLSLRRRHRRAEEPAHRRGVRHDVDRRRRRQDARRSTSPPPAARRARTRTTRTSIASASTAPA